VNVSSYQRAGLASNTLRYYRIYAYNDSGDSGYSAVVYARTFAAISDPTNLVATPWSDTEIEIVFQDNSSEEDGHEVYRKDTGAYALIITLAPNQDFYRDPSLTKGLTYTYKVRAKQGSSFTGYSNEASATTISEPAAPTVLAISEIKDKSMRLTWTPTTGEVGYKIEKSTDGGSNYTEIAKLTAEVSYFLARGLTPSTEYYFKIRAYNKAGNSSYTSAVHDTTLAGLTRSAFEALVRKPIATLIYLIEMNPKITLAGWSLTSGKTYTYEVGVQERGIDIEEAFENGVALTKKTSIADVESTASSFYSDFFGRKFYVHTSGGDSPINYLIEGAFWLYFTNYSPGASPTVFNEKNYLPLLEKADIPDACQEISPLFEGNFSIASGSITIKNAKIGGEYYWDKRYARYTFENRKVRVLAGGPGFAYADFEAIFPAFIDALSISDQAITFDLKDFRGGLSRDLPINHLWKTDYPELSDNENGKVIPLGIGALTNLVPICINATNRRYKLRDGRIKSVAAVKQNGVTLTGGTDYYIDYQRGIITLSRSLVFDNADVVTVDFDGLCNLAGELLSNGADLFIWICQNLLNLSLTELDLDSIYKTKYDRTAALASPFHRQIKSDEVFRTLEHSCLAYTYQDSQGRLGFRTLDTIPVSDVRYVRNCEIFEFSRNRGNESVFRGVNVWYNEDPQHDNNWAGVTATDNQALWKKQASEILDIYTWLTTQADAEAVATALKNDLQKDYINFSVHTLLFGCMAGDLIYFSRDRFPSASGSANKILLRIMSIQKQISAGKTIIKGVTIS
jgi:hypothetical protein